MATSVIFRSLDKRHEKILDQVQKELGIGTRSATVVALIDQYQRDRDLSELRGKQLDQLTAEMRQLLDVFERTKRASEDLTALDASARALLKSFAQRPRQTRIDHNY